VASPCSRMIIEHIIASQNYSSTLVVSVSEAMFANPHEAHTTGGQDAALAAPKKGAGMSSNECKLGGTFTDFILVSASSVKTGK
jgi:hypothetical protein